VLAHSLRDNGTRVPLVILITENVGGETVERLKVRVGVAEASTGC
jgi:hypothetical protein